MQQISQTETIAAIPQLSTVVVTKTAMETRVEDPSRLVSDVVEFVTTTMHREGRFRKAEMPQNVMQAYNCEVYRGYVDHSGHAKYIGVAGKLAESSLTDVVEGLRGMGADDQANLAQQALDWVRTHPDQIKQQKKPEHQDPSLTALDAPFQAANESADLKELNAAWIAGWDNLEVVSDAAHAHVLKATAEMNPRKDLREKELMYHAAKGALGNSTPLAMGYAATSNPRALEMITNYGRVERAKIEDEDATICHIQTNAGPRISVVTPTTVRHLAPANNADGNDILCEVDMAEVAKLRVLCTELEAPDYVCTLFDKAYPGKKLGALSVMVNADAPGTIGIFGTVYVDEEAVVLFFRIGQGHGAVMKWGSETDLATVTAQEVEAWVLQFEGLL